MKILAGAVHPRNSNRDLPWLFNHPWSELSFIPFPIFPGMQRLEERNGRYASSLQYEEPEEPI
jgi:hypothetical protein